MAAGVDLKDHIVSARLDRLIELFDQVEQMKSDVASMRDQQTGAWPAIASVQGFVREYQSSLQVTAEDLEAIQATIGEFHQALLDSTRSLKNIDQDVQDRLQQLADRIATVPEPAPKPATSTTGLGGLGGPGAGTAPVRSAGPFGQTPRAV